MALGQVFDCVSVAGPLCCMCKDYCTVRGRRYTRLDTEMEFLDGSLAAGKSVPVRFMFDAEHQPFLFRFSTKLTDIPDIEYQLDQYLTLLLTTGCRMQ